MIKALIFDVDGTLAETEEAHRLAFNAAFEAMNVGADWPDPANNWVWSVPLYQRLLKTTGGKERIAAYLREDLQIDPEPWRARIAALHQDKTARFTGMLSSGGLKLREGILDLVEAARARDLKVAIATTTSRPNVAAVCQAGFGRAADAVFDVIAAGDEVANKKPAPDVYLLALERLGLPAADCVAIEDSRNGLLSAKAAGLRCLVSPGQYMAEESVAEADWLIESFTQAPATLFDG